MPVRADLDIFSPPTSRKPCTAMRAGGSIPAAISSAGQYTQWNRRMSLPIRWWTAGHQRGEPFGIGRRSRWRWRS